MFRRAPGRVPVRCRALDTPTKALVGLCCQGRAGRGVLPPRVTDSIKWCPQDTPTLNAAVSITPPRLNTTAESIFMHTNVKDNDFDYFLKRVGKNSFSVPVIITSGRRLIVARVRIGNPIPIDFAEAGMPIDKAQNRFCFGIISVYQWVPRTAEERRPLACQHRLGRTLNGTQLLTRDARNRAGPHLVAVEGITRERVSYLCLKDSIRGTDKGFLVP